MGQYHYTVNLDKKQFIHPHKLGDGLKLLEQCGWSPGGTNDALHMLLAACSGRGGGDFQSDSEWIGSWAGDRIAVIGDYAEPDDIAGVNAQEVYGQCGDGGEFKDITDELIPIMEAEYELVYCDMDRFGFDVIEGFSGSHGRGDRSIMIDEKEYLSSEVRAAIKRFYGDPKNSRVKTVTVEQLGLTPREQRSTMVRPA